MIQVIENEITQYNLPKTGHLKDGSSVSGYDMLDKEILKGEGWLPLEDVEPEYDELTQYILPDGYEIQSKKVIKKYVIREIPEQVEPMDELAELRELVNILLGSETDE